MIPVLTNDAQHARAATERAAGELPVPEPEPEAAVTVVASFPPSTQGPGAAGRWR